MKTTTKLKNKRKSQKYIDITDSREAERAKNEPRVLFDSYIKKRWPNGIN